MAGINLLNIVYDKLRAIIRNEIGYCTDALQGINEAVLGMKFGLDKYHAKQKLHAS